MIKRILFILKLMLLVIFSDAMLLVFAPLPIIIALIVYIINGNNLFNWAYEEDKKLSK